MELDKYSQALIALTDSVGSASFYQNINTLISCIIDFDELLVMQFNKTANAKLHYRYGIEGTPNQLQGEDAWKYLSRLYVLDPFYRVFSDKGEHGFFALKEIAPDEFANLYSSYFNFLTLSDEAGYLFPIDSENALHIDLSRFADSPPFTALELQQLKCLFLPLQDLCQKHLSTIDLNEENAHSNVQDLLLNFGKEILTNKEYQVCQLLLKGHSAKAVASEMNIGYETVKMHKKNIYGKTSLSSQSELLALFINLLQSESLDKGIDHLAKYVSKQQHLTIA
ncbi:helix-turn-helix transcriptional regulator [Psychromonas marina]|uniref:Helix-turn-helix transcriptional regulator n=1 Tax=Psychromonas marina TaxID=88364 RepID=A0ABQ6DXN1_9GAMM|nr:helix-turn-helix transcriptional regulator [Psychromonas marina]GLS89902.1 helix-turn-helix transcriptional regulator [Psychromonas marina]